MLRRLTTLLTMVLLLTSMGCDDDDSSTGPQTPESTARIYFAENPQDCSNSLIRAIDVGQDAAETVITLNGPDSVRDLAIDSEAGWIYYTFSGSGANDEDTVRRIRVDGTSPETLATYGLGELTPDGIALDPANDAVYWLAANGCSPCPSCGDCSEIVQAGLTGANPTAVHTITGTANPSNIAIDPTASQAYWTDNQYAPDIRRVDTDGTDQTTVYERPVGESNGVDDVEVDVAAGLIYWLEDEGIGDAVEINRANLDGSDVQTLLTVGGSRASTPRGLALDPQAGKLYWTESGYCNDTPSGRLRRANLDGTGVETVLDGLGVLVAIEVVS